MSPVTRSTLEVTYGRYPSSKLGTSFGPSTPPNKCNERLYRPMNCQCIYPLRIGHQVTRFSTGRPPGSLFSKHRTGSFAPEISRYFTCRYGSSGPASSPAKKWVAQRVENVCLSRPSRKICLCRSSADSALSPSNPQPPLDSRLRFLCVVLLSFSLFSALTLH